MPLRLLVSKILPKPGASGAWFMGSISRCLQSLTRLCLINVVVCLPALWPIMQQLVSLDLQGSLLLSEKGSGQCDPGSTDFLGTTDFLKRMAGLERLSLRDASHHVGALM